MIYDVEAVLEERKWHAYCVNLTQAMKSKVNQWFNITLRSQEVVEAFVINRKAPIKLCKSAFWGCTSTLRIVGDLMRCAHDEIENTLTWITTDLCLWSKEVKGSHGINKFTIPALLIIISK